MWALLLNEVLALGDSSGSRRGSDVARAFAEDNLPFWALNEPFVAVGFERLRASLCLDNHFGSDAQSALARGLLQRLTTISWRTYFLEFSLERRLTRGTSFLNTVNRPANRQFDSFLSGQLGGGLVDLFLRYPVMAKLLATVTLQWVTFIEDFVDRLREDRTQLHTTFGCAGAIVGVDPFLSDPHDGGNTVMVVTFESGLPIVYKPRDLSIEAAFYQLLKSLRDADFDPGFCVPTHLARGEYGWMSFHGPAACESREQVQRYYQRAGALLCLVYALNGTDIHSENLIAHGEHPVIVDLEALVQPRGDVDAEASDALHGAHTAALIRFETSVLNTMLLPEWSMPDSASRIDESGFGVDNVSTRITMASWQNANSDAMDVSDTVELPNVGSNSVRLGSSAQPASEFIDELVQGFQAAYHLLLNRRGDLLAADGLLDEFAAVRCRFVFRGSRTYEELLIRSFSPKRLTSGISWSLPFEQLAKPLTTSEFRPALWSVFAAEVEALEQLDIPRFSMLCSQTGVLARDEIVDCFQESGIERTRALMAALSERDLAWQLSLIRAAVCARFADEASGPHDSNRSTSSIKDGRDVSPAELTENAMTIARTLREGAIWGDDGSATWIGIQYSAAMSGHRVAPIDESLYSGTTGVAVFFAALARVTGDRTFAETAEAALKPAFKLFERRSAHVWQEHQLGFGGASGVGSLVYGATVAGALCGRSDWIEAAQAAASAIEVEQIVNDRELDVTNGVSGLLIALLASHSCRPDPQILAFCERIGGHLLDVAQSPSPGLCGWADSSGAFLAGMAHGPSGVMLALSRLARCTDDRQLQSRCADTLAGGLALERCAEVSPELGWGDTAWPKHPTQSASVAWCYGAPGIALSRLEMGELLGNDPSLVRERDMALRLTRDADLSSVDHVCCGNFGRVEALLTAAHRLQRQDLAVSARGLAAQVVRGSSERGSYSMFPHLSGDQHCPSFFKGLSGIGYHLLRLGAPETLPSIVSWEPPLTGPGPGLSA